MVDPDPIQKPRDYSLDPSLLHNGGPPLKKCDSSRWLFVAFIVAEIGGMGLLVCAGAQLFGPVASRGFIASFVWGGVICLFAAGGLIFCILKVDETKEVPPRLSASSLVSSDKKKDPLNDEKDQESDPTKQNPKILLPRGSSKKNDTVDLSLFIDQDSLDEDEELNEILKRLIGIKQRGGSIAQALKEIPETFFADKSHSRAKAVLFSVVPSLFGCQISFPEVGAFFDPDTIEKKSLDNRVFQWSITQGVEGDIPRSSKDEDHTHIYQVASQYNGAEAPNVFTPGIGKAMEASKNDHTQGPMAQRTNPELFEVITAFFANLGGNMLNNVLPSAGDTYQPGALIEDGYLRLKDEDVGPITAEFKKNCYKTEYLCYESLGSDWPGAKTPVFIFLQSAPAIKYSTELTVSTDELQKWVSFANYLALFRYAILTARLTSKRVVVHANSPGGGVFGNTAENICWGFEKAALYYQQQMAEEGVRVQLEEYCPSGKLSSKSPGVMQTIAKRLSLSDEPRSRIGD